MMGELLAPAIFGIEIENINLMQTHYTTKMNRSKKEWYPTFLDISKADALPRWDCQVDGHYNIINRKGYEVLMLGCIRWGNLLA
jgi:hypothetical protein